MRKIESSISSRLEKKEDIPILPVSLLNQHISQLAKTLFTNERKKAHTEKKFHFPLIDYQTYRQKTNHQLLLNEVFILVVRMEVAELKLAQLDRKLSKKIKSLTALKTELEKESKKKNESPPEERPERPERLSTTDEEPNNKLLELRDNVKAAIDVEFVKFIDKL